MNSLLTRIAVLSILALSAASSPSCKTKAQPQKEPSRPAGPPVEENVAAASYSSFGIDLYRVLGAARPDANLFISPASVAIALAMTRGGAEGETRDAMTATLRLPPSASGVTERADSSFIASLGEAMKGVELSIANSIWARYGVDFKKDFLAANSTFYGAEVRTLDFNDPGAPKTINAWVAEKTRNKITGIIDEIDRGSILYLINAIYFKGSWATKFDKKLTADRPFHLAGGRDVSAPFMNRSGSFDYLEGPSFQAVRLPYGDGRIAMYVFLPDSVSSLASFRDSLTIGRWHAWTNRFVERPGMVALPRFRMEYKTKLKGPLSDLGMEVAFDPSSANFTGMLNAGDEKVFIYDVIHKTFVDVNAEGTEAAAVTGVEMRLTSVMEPQRPFRMICDRPFFFAIVDSQTGLILFMGDLANPS